jgi:hypothetical protein
MATARPYGFREQSGASVNAAVSLSSYGSYANLIIGRFCVNLAAAALLSSRA